MAHIPVPSNNTFASRIFVEVIDDLHALGLNVKVTVMGAHHTVGIGHASGMFPFFFTQNIFT